MKILFKLFLSLTVVTATSTILASCNGEDGENSINGIDGKDDEDGQGFTPEDLILLIASIKPKEGNC
ncbi:hypothetical protein VOI54_10345 [Tamlana sp. 2201CG12-4]|uniref:Vmc-like lipoprotein signal peptide domain-containing protein n=1 Tax=Tamlana sp. 2201CG12-4 TaxID=3112582 RepID=UPI002DBDF0B1|nr:hypothetical protein [Tamlana sp. 2201CG12-4]MEC3907419.1 hypothetical protein [Tamlana sp. 2201CG12-4]